jgi:HrpA-like RNA helicase
MYSYETLNEFGSKIAYQVRFEGNKTNRTRILFLTEVTEKNLESICVAAH